MAHQTQLEKAELAADLAHDDAAVGIEFAEEYRIFGNIKLYYPTVAHRWVLMKLGGEAFKKLDNFDKAAIMAYVLSAKMPENLSRLSAELRKNDALEAALRWIAANDVPPEITIAVRDLLQHPYAGAADTTDPTNRAPSTITGGANSSTDSQ